MSSIQVPTGATASLNLRNFLTKVRRRGTHSQRSSDEVSDFIQLLDLLRVHCAAAGDLQTALSNALTYARAPWAREALRVAVLGGSPWREVASQTDEAVVRKGCSVLEVGWQSAQTQGTSLTVFLEYVRGLCREHIETAALAKEETAALTLSARLLTALPLLSLPLGILIGSNPLTWLIGSGVGHVILGIGLAMNAAAWALNRQIIRRATSTEQSADALVVCAAAFAAIAARQGARGLDLTAALAQLLPLDPTGTLANVLSAVDLGIPAYQAWNQVAMPSRHWVPLGTAMSQMERTGMLVPHVLAAISRDTAYEVRTAVRERVRRASVLILLPTGLLGLPAFMLLTVVPLVAAHFSHMPWLTTR